MKNKYWSQFKKCNKHIHVDDEENNKDNSDNNEDKKQATMKIRLKTTT